MREYWILTKLQFSSLFGINKILHMKSEAERKQGKKSLYGLIAMVFAIGYVSIVYSIMLAEGFAAIGMLPTLLGLMMLAGAMLVLVFSVFETKGVLFGFGDYDTVMSWPVDVRAVAASRVTCMYLYNFVYAALFLLPAGAVYAVKATPAWWYYPLYLLLTLLMPALPTAVGAALGTLLTVSTARMKKRNAFNIAGQMALVIVLMVVSFRTSSGMADLSERAASLKNVAARYYPPAAWFQNVLTGGSALGMLWILLLSAGALLLMVLAAGRWFVSINSRLKSAPRGERFVMRAQRRSGILRALYRKELSRYFSSSLYVVNTSFGYVMMLAAGVFCVVKPDLLADAFQTPELSQLRLLVPFVIALIATMSSTTGSTISMEGKTLWIVKSMPVSARSWLTGKLLVSLTLAVPCILISCTLVGIGMRAGGAEWFWLYIIPLVYAAAFGVFGLWLNIRMPKLEWQNEAEVVKQSMAVMICVFAGMGAAAIPAVILAITGAEWVVPCTAAIALLLTLWMWRSLMKSGERRLLRLA